MNYYIDLIRTGDGTFTIGPYKSPPLVDGDKIYTDNDRLTLVLGDSSTCTWLIYQRTETTPPDPDTLTGYDSFQIRAEVEPDTAKGPSVWLVMVTDHENTRHEVLGAFHTQEAAEKRFEQERTFALDGLDENQIMEDEPRLLSIMDSDYDDCTGYVLEAFEQEINKGD